MGCFMQLGERAMFICMSLNELFNVNCVQNEDPRSHQIAKLDHKRRLLMHGDTCKIIDDVLSVGRLHYGMQLSVFMNVCAKRKV